MSGSQRLARSFYEGIQADLAASITSCGFDAVLTDDPEDVAYLTGFFHHPHERPVAVAVDSDGRAVLLVPELEREHAETQNAAADVVTYKEFPGTSSPWRPLVDRLGAVARIGHPGGLSVVRAGQLAELAPHAKWEVSEIVMAQRAIKRPEEIGLHRRAAAITDRMLIAGVAAVEEAVRGSSTLPSEAELATIVTRTGIDIMYGEDTDVVVVSPLAGGLVYTGANSAQPHALPSATRLRRGEPFMLSLGCAVGGRFVEGERTFFLGEPSEANAAVYRTVRAAQQAGAAAIAPGAACRDVDRAGFDVVEAAGFTPHRRHRQGHGIGVGMHEPPWLESGDATPLAAGMVVSNEPGLYLPGVGGFRISDSTLVTDNGSEPLTTYPRELDDVVVAA